MLEKYVQMFAHIRTDRGRDRYPAITYHRAPHKPFLLLSVMELIAQGRITQNLIEPSYDLVEKDEAPVSRRLQIEQNLPSHILTLRDRLRWRAPIHLRLPDACLGLISVEDLM
jgi:hypothetical protein